MNDFRRRLLMAFRKKKSDIPKDGVYIQDIDGAFWTYEEWNQDNSRANGVAVVDSRHPQGGFVIAKEYSKGIYGKWGKLINNVTTIESDKSVAKTDYLGKSNTEQIISQDSTAEAAIYCDSFTFPNGQKGYLGAAGEWWLACENKAEIDICLNRIEAMPMIATGEEEYFFLWCSTQGSLYNGWMMWWYNEEISIYEKGVDLYIRPFTTLKPSKDGIYILGIDNILYKDYEWSQPNENAVGIAVIDSRHPNGGFVIAKENKNDLSWSKDGVYDLVSGVTTTTDSSTAKVDYKGIENTNAIVNHFGDSTDYSAGYCNNYTFPNGQKGYLGALGEWQIAYENKSEVDTCLALISPTCSMEDMYVATSTQNSQNSSWTRSWKDSSVIAVGKHSIDKAHPFSELPENYSFYEPSRKEVVSVIFKRNESNPENITIEGDKTILDRILGRWRRCLCKKTGEGKVSICYLGDTNSNYFYDMSTPSDLTGAQGDVMTVVPEFWYKYRNINDDYFAYDISEMAINEGVYIKKSLLGTYKAYQTGGKLYSRSGVSPTVNTSWNQFNTYATARGKGYSMIDFEQHCMIAFMLYAKYRNRNLQAVLGAGKAEYNPSATKVGTTNNLGNQDTIQNNSKGYVNGLGIEGVFGGIYEMVSGVKINDRVWTITNLDGTQRTVNAGASNGWITNIKGEEGEIFDVIPTQTGGSETTYYSDHYYSGSSSYNSVLSRSSNDWVTDGGVAYSNASISPSNTYVDSGTRLSFRGEITEIDDIQEFIAIDGGVTKDDLTDGVYILRTNNKYYKEEDWNTEWNSEAVGVAVIDSRHPNKGFVIAKTDMPESQWGYPSNVTSIVNTDNTTTASKDYLGEYNTNQILAAEPVPTDETAPARCKNFIFPNGKNGYLGAAGEWYIVGSYKNEIADYMKYIGGTSISTGDRWTSTTVSYTVSWAVGNGNNIEDWNYLRTLSKSNDTTSRPFTTLQ